jgi:hypothetical protein
MGGLRLFGGCVPEESWRRWPPTWWGSRCTWAPPPEVAGHRGQGPGEHRPGGKVHWEGAERACRGRGPPWGGKREGPAGTTFGTGLTRRRWPPSSGSRPWGAGRTSVTSPRRQGSTPPPAVRSPREVAAHHLFLDRTMPGDLCQGQPSPTDQGGPHRPSAGVHRGQIEMLGSDHAPPYHREKRCRSSPSPLGHARGGDPGPSDACVGQEGGAALDVLVRAMAERRRRCSPSARVASRREGTRTS